MSKVNKLATITAIIGLVIITVVIISGVSYPHPLFIYGTAMGMLMVFSALFLYVVSWCSELIAEIKAKNIVGILILIITAIIFIITFIRR